MQVEFAPAQVNAQAQAMTAKIRVVDADGAVRKRTIRRLEAAGYQVAVAGDAGSAEQVFANVSPDLLLIDLHLAPGSPHRYSITRSAQMRRPDLQMVFMTGGDPHAPSIHKSTGVLLRKPFSAEDLPRTVAGLL